MKIIHIRNVQMEVQIQFKQDPMYAIMLQLKIIFQIIPLALKMSNFYAYLAVITYGNKIEKSQL